MNDRIPSHALSDSPDWWGPRWISVSGDHGQARRGYMTVFDLIDAGTIDPWVAALLWELIARRSSIIVIAGPSGVGKTTLLTALTDFVPPAEHLRFVRGVFDPLTFLDDPAVEPEATTAMVNEISPHLPVYLWGPGVGRLLTSRRRFRVFATAHATSARDLVAQLAGYPLRVPLAGVARLDIVVGVEAWMDNGAVRRAVTEITAFASSDRNGIVLTHLLAPGTNTLDHGAVNAWLGEVSGKGDHDGVAIRHNILVGRGSVHGESDTSESPLRTVLAAAFARARGVT